MNLRRYLLKKAVSVLLAIFLITALNFFLFQILPGDPTRVLIPRGCVSGGTTNITGVCSLRTQIIHEWGLDQPVFLRFIIYLGNLLHGDFGTSITYLGGGLPVAGLIANGVYQTLLLVGVATFFTMWLGIILGRASGWRRGQPSDVVVTLTTLTGYSMPSFWASGLLILLFYEYIPIAQIGPIAGFDKMSLPEQLVNQLYRDMLPILTFVITNVAWFSLTLRNTLTETLPEDYMTTARAKGLTPRDQLRRHAMPNARLPLVTASALYFGWIFSGAIVVENIFSIQGVGLLTWQATENLDYPLLSALFLLATIGVVIANAAADLLYVALDPRVREA